MAYNAPVEHRTGTLAKAVGPYPAGCLITTDTKVPVSGEKTGENTVFSVDPRRFDSWAKSSMVRLPAAKPTGPKKDKERDKETDKETVSSDG